MTTTFFKFNDVITYLTENYRFSLISIMLEHAQTVYNKDTGFECISHAETGCFIAPLLMRQMECEITSYIFDNELVMQKATNQLVTIY